MTPALHPETEKMIDAFARSLKVKLARAEAKYGYSDNWRTDDWEADCQCDLAKHVAKGDPLDVAAYAAFCWARGYRTSPVEGLTSGEGVNPQEYLDFADAMHARLFYPSGATRDDAKPYQIARRLGVAVKTLANAIAASPKATATASVRELLERVKGAARYVPVGDGYFDPYTSHVEAVDAAVDRLAAALTDSGTAATIGGERA